MKGHWLFSLSVWLVCTSTVLLSLHWYMKSFLHNVLYCLEGDNRAICSIWSDSQNFLGLHQPQKGFRKTQGRLAYQTGIYSQETFWDFPGEKTLKQHKGSTCGNLALVSLPAWHPGQKLNIQMPSACSGDLFPFCGVLRTMYSTQLLTYTN